MLGALVVRRARAARQPARRDAVARGFLGYALGYTVLAQAPHVAEHRLGRRGRRRAAAGRLGRRRPAGSTGLALYLFAIVFFWTPPHFWALSLLMKDEYAKVGVPMLPVVRGEDETRRQILLYTVLLYAVTQLPFCAGGFGASTSSRRSLLGAAFIGAVRAAAAPRRPALRPARVPLLARLPRAAVRRYGGRRPALKDPDAMDRNLARKNVRSGLIVTAVCFFMFGLTFVAAGDLHRLI